MSLLDRVRTLAPPTRAKTGPMALARTGLTAVVAVVVSYALLCLPVLATWGVTTEASTPWTSVLDVGGGALLLAHFVPLHIGPSVVSLTPLLLALGPLLVAASAATRTLAAVPPAATRLERLHLMAAFVVPYAVCVLAVAVVSPSGPGLARSLVPSLVFPAVAYTAAGGWARRSDDRSPFDPPGGWQGVAVVTLRRAMRPAGWGVAALLGAGAVLVLALVVLHGSRVAGVHGTLHPGLVGGIVLSLVQVLALPNAAVWAASFLAGPGFALGSGDTVTWSASEPALLPLVPAFAALPDPGALPSWLWLLAALPVGAGVLVGRLSLRALTRLSSWQVKARTAGTACLLVSLAMAALAWLSGGSLGVGRLSEIGAPALTLGGVLLGQLVLGAGAAVGWSHWRARRR